MVSDTNLDSVQQPQNQVSEDAAQLSSAISYQNGYHSSIGGSSTPDSSFNVSHLTVQMPYQDTVARDVNISVQNNIINSGTRMPDSIVITASNSSLNGGSHVPGLGSNSIESPTSTSGGSTNHFSTKRQGGQHQSPASMSRFGMTAQQASVPQMKNQKKRRVQVKEESSPLLYQPQQPLSKDPMQLKSYDSAGTAGMFQRRPSQDHHQQQQTVPNPQMVHSQLQQIGSNSQMFYPQLQQTVCNSQMFHPQQQHPVQNPQMFHRHQHHIVPNPQMFHNRQQLTVPNPHMFHSQQKHTVSNPQMFLTQNPLVNNTQGHHSQAPHGQQVPLDVQKQLSTLTAAKSDTCVRQTMLFMHHQREGISKNNIEYWRKLVNHHYAPFAKKRWCFSEYALNGCSALGVNSQAKMDSGKCGLCGSNSVWDFVQTCDILPTMMQQYFSSGIIDEIMYLDAPVERLLHSGQLMLSFGKAVQESIYEKCRVVHEGKLRVIFSQELKILSWEFCVQRHEEFIPLKLIKEKSKTFQFNEFTHYAARCQGNVEAKENGGAPDQGSLENKQRLKSTEKRTLLELPLISEIGLPKSFVRCLQTSEVLHSMKDLMTYSQRTKLSPSESFKRYPQAVAPEKLNMMHMEDRPPMQPTQGFPDQRKFPAVNGDLNSNAPHNSQAPNSNMAHTPSGSERVMCHSPISYEKLLQVPITPDSYQSSYSRPLLHSLSHQGPMSSPWELLDTSSLSDSKFYKRMVNDILRNKKEESMRTQRENSQGDCNAVNDPNAEHAHIGLDGAQKGGRTDCKVENELNTASICCRKNENVKGVNSSSSSGST